MCRCRHIGPTTWTTPFINPGSVPGSHFSSRPTLGPLTGGSQMSPVDFKKLQKGNVLCRYFCNFHIESNIAQCHLSNLRKPLCHVGTIFLVSISLMSSVNFKKWPCRPVELKGQGPLLVQPPTHLSSLSPNIAHML